MAFKDVSVIERLNMSNYSNWKFKMQMLLIKEELFNVISDNPPETITDDWRKRDNKARALINLFIENDQIAYVREKNTARETWDTLKGIHERQNLSSKLFLLRKLYNTKLEEKGNMVTHITKILQIIDKLKAIGENISDDHLSAILLCSVPPSYDTLITALEARPEIELNPDFIRSKLIDEFTRRVENMQTKEIPSKAFQINKRINYGNNFKRDYNNKFCTNCKLHNHTNSNCWHLNKQHNQRRQRYPAYNNNNNYANKLPKQNKSSLCYDQDDQQTDKNELQESKYLTSKFKNMTFLTGQAEKDTWIIDSGSSSHMSNNEKLFTEITDRSRNKVIIANGKALTTCGSGEIKLKTKTSTGEENTITLKNVLLVPELEANLLSVNKATENGCTVIFENNKCEIYYENNLCIEGKIKNNLYEITLNNAIEQNFANLVKSCENKNCIELWHRRLGHRNYQSIVEMKKKEMAIGIELNNCTHDKFCESCVKSKMSDNPYPKIAKYRATKILELIHTDVCGPIKTPTIGGKIYFLTLIDDYSRFTIIYLLSRKNEVLDRIKEFVAMVENMFGHKPKCLRSDNGGEYIGHESEKYLKQMGINHQLIVPRCPSQNGVAERKNRSLMEMTRTLLTQSNLPHRFWGEAIITANWLQNRLPTKANPCTPYELWTERKPNLSFIKVFGCKAYTYVDKTKRSKLSNKAEEGIFLGYDNRSKGYRIYNGGNEVTISRTVKFVENEFPYAKFKTEESLIFENENPTQHIDKNTNSENEESSIEIELDNESENIQSQLDNTITQEFRRSTRSNRGVPPERFTYLTHENTINEPKGWEDLMTLENTHEKQNWLKATDEEIKSLKLNNTWTLVDPPIGKRVIGSRWTFKAKYNSNGVIDKFKARLVAKGNNQRYGEDYDETYAPVVSHTAIRSFLAKAAHENLKVNHVDIKTAFLHGKLDEEVYMRQPDGYIVVGEEEKVCKLNKAIYGLKQAARAWNIKIGNILKNIGFERCQNEHCLYKATKDGKTTYIIIYVDDLLIAGQQSIINEVINYLQSQFQITNLGEISYYLGMSIRKTHNGNYAINQKLKIENIVKEFGLENSKPETTPLDAGYLKNDDNETNLLPNNHNYRKAIGSLLYIATTCRPDICAAVNILSRKLENPCLKDWEQVKRVIKYLKYTKDLELIISCEEKPTLRAWADADYAGDVKDRKSTSGNVFFLGKTPIYWQTKKQNSVSLSSAEAEYVSAATASQEILYISKLLEDLDIKQEYPITLFEDNQSTIKMIESPKCASKSKHINVKFHFIKDLKENNIINLKYCPTSEMTADLFTKPLCKPTFLKHRENLLSFPNDVDQGGNEGK